MQHDWNCRAMPKRELLALGRGMVVVESQITALHDLRGTLQRLRHRLTCKTRFCTGNRQLATGNSPARRPS